MDRDAGMSDRSEEARQGDTGMIGSESEEPGPGRDTSLTEPDPVAAGAEQPKTTVAMSEGDPMATRLGSHVEGAGAATAPLADERDPDLAAEPVADQGAYARGVEDVGPSDSAAFADEPVAPERPAFATEDAGAPDRSAVAADDPARLGAGDAMAYTGQEADVTDRPGGGGSPFTDEEPGVQEGVYDQEADRARQQRLSDGR
jgi:hypothetical protein